MVRSRAGKEGSGQLKKKTAAKKPGDKELVTKAIKVEVTNIKEIQDIKTLYEIEQMNSEIVRIGDYCILELAHKAPKEEEQDNDDNMPTDYDKKALDEVEIVIKMIF